LLQIRSWRGLLADGHTRPAEQTQQHGGSRHYPARHEHSPFALAMRSLASRHAFARVVNQPDDSRRRHFPAGRRPYSVTSATTSPVAGSTSKSWLLITM